MRDSRRSAASRFARHALTRREFLSVGLGASVGLALAACGGAAAPASSAAAKAPGSSSSGPASAAPASSAAAGSTAASKASASGSGAPKSVAELAAYQGSDRQQLLEEGAKKETGFTWYTSLTGTPPDELVAAFKKKYPFVQQPEIFRAAEDQLITRISQEAQAGKNTFDVLECPEAGALLLGEANLLAPFYSPALTRIPDDFKTKPSGGQVQGATMRLSLIGFGYNTTLIPQSAVPKTTKDLLNPALSGKLTLAGTTTGQRWLGSVLHSMGDSDGRAFLKDLASRQKVSVQQISGQAVNDLIAKGEVASSPTIFRDNAELAASRGGPVKWIGLDPVTANVGQVSLDAKAPHPNTALLFIDFVLTEGQEMLKNDHFGIPTEKLPFAYWVPEAGSTAKQVEENMNSWADLFKATFR